MATRLETVLTMWFMAIGMEKRDRRNVGYWSTHGAELSCPFALDQPTLNCYVREKENSATQISIVFWDFYYSNVICI